MLDSRLLKIAGLVPVGAKVADIGTDHALLPIYLIESKIATKVIASDVKMGPLSAARKNIDKSMFGDKIDLRLSNGLDEICGDEVDTVIISGMGGELIADIISRAIWLRDSKYRLILQPMSSAMELRKFLSENNFKINHEHAVLSVGRIYSVIEAGYTGKECRNDPLFCYIGGLSDNVTKDALVYIKRVRRILDKRSHDILDVENKQKEYNELISVVLQLDRIILGND